LIVRDKNIFITLESITWPIKPGVSVHRGMSKYTAKNTFHLDRIWTSPVACGAKKLCGSIKRYTATYHVKRCVLRP
jgi:hypothetical protein